MYETDSYVISFAKGLDTTTRSDIRALLQDSDRFASSTYNRDAFWDLWMSYYTNRLQKHGCQQLARITSAPLFISDSDELDTLTLQATGPERPQGLFDLAQRIIENLQIRSFVDAWLASSGEGNGLLGSWVAVPCEVNRHGQIILTTFGVQLKGRPKTTQQKPEVVMRMGGATYVFDPELHAPWRDEIRARIEGIALRRIYEVTI